MCKNRERERNKQTFLWCVEWYLSSGIARIRGVCLIDSPFSHPFFLTYSSFLSLHSSTQITSESAVFRSLPSRLFWRYPVYYALCFPSERKNSHLAVPVSCSTPSSFSPPQIVWISLMVLSVILFLLQFQALHQLYYDPNIENKNLAQKWLMQAQVSPQAWQFCWALLSPDKV